MIHEKLSSLERDIMYSSLSCDFAEIRDPLREREESL